MFESVVRQLRLSDSIPSKSKLLALWRHVTAIPTVKGGAIHSTSDCGEGRFVSATFETPDVDGNTRAVTERSYFVSSNGKVHRPKCPSSVVDGKTSFYFSPSRERRVHFTAAEGTELIANVYSQSGERLIRFPIAKAHGAILPSPYFQNVTWNQSETKFAYVAERNVAACAKLWDAAGKSAKDSSATLPFEHKQSFGETMKDFSSLSVFLCDLESRTITEAVPSSFAEAYCCMNPQFVGDELWFNATSYFPERLGLAHCASRPNKLFAVTTTATTQPEPREIAYPHGHTCLRNIRVKGNTLVCLSAAPNCPAHSCCYALCTADISRARDLATNDTFRVVIPIVSLPSEANDYFPGLYSATGNDLFWLTEDTLLISSARRSASVLYKVDLKSGRTELFSTEHGNWSILDVWEEHALVAHSTTIQPARILLIDKSCRTTIIDEVKLPFDSASVATDCVGSLTTEVICLPEHHDTEALFHRSKAVDGAATMLFVHGGPHAVDTNMFSHNMYFLLLCGFQILSVNYGGSLGFGQIRIDELLGNIGTNDVTDCMAAFAAISEHVTPGKVAVSGGSHGGFLTAHLSGRFPNEFQVALLRNPVIDLPSMFWVTDIKDWCLAEAGLCLDAGNFDERFVTLLRDCSPMQFAPQVTAATMIGIGLEDLRVPVPQGRAWYYAIRRAYAVKGVAPPPMKVLEYPSIGHAMDSPQAAADFHINAVAFCWENFK